MYEVKVPWEHSRAPHIEASSCRTSTAPLVRRKSSPFASESVNLSDVDFEKTTDALPKALMELEESGRERLTLECDMARLPIWDDFVIRLGPALRICRPALAIGEHLESMEKRISVIEEAVSAPLPTSLSAPSPAAPAQDNPLSQAPKPPPGEAPISAPLQPWRRPSVEGQPERSLPTQQCPVPTRSTRRSWEPRRPTTGTSTPR